jgi:hypothetical protein
VDRVSSSAGCAGASVHVDNGPIVQFVRNLAVGVESMVVRMGSTSSYPGDHCEGQFEGQNCASECLSEPVSACVS